MKKIIKIVLIGLFLLFLIVSTGIFIFLKTFDVNRFKPQIISVGQNALGRSKACALRLMLIGLGLLTLNGCTFIVKDDHATKYYGIDQERGSEYLSQILDKQQQVYQAEKASVSSKRP